PAHVLPTRPEAITRWRTATSVGRRDGTIRDRDGERRGAGREEPMWDGFEGTDETIGEATYRVVQGGDGPPVLLLHGFPQTHECWHRIAPALADTHRVVA